jgi:hypothetical protein
MAKKLLAIVCFSDKFADPYYTHNPRCDPELAVAVLRREGYEVAYLPANSVGHTAHPLDHFAEAVIAGAHDPHNIYEIKEEVGDIVRPFGGICFECGPLEENHEPFADLFNWPPLY